MSLLDIAKSIKKEGFDPRKDSANGPAPIPAGEYQAILKSVKFNISEKNWESIQYCFEIRGGDYNGRVEYANFGTLDTWNGKDISWSVQRTIKFFQKALAFAGDAPLKADFEDGKALEEALQRKAVGSYFKLIIIETESKGKTYRSYDLDEAEGLPTAEVLEVSDDDLPF